MKNYARMLGYLEGLVWSIARGARQGRYADAEDIANRLEVALEEADNAGLNGRMPGGLPDIDHLRKILEDA